MFCLLWVCTVTSADPDYPYEDIYLPGTEPETTTAAVAETTTASAGAAGNHSHHFTVY